MSCPKVLNVVNYTQDVHVLRSNWADVNYCADVKLFLHATSGGLSLTAAFFSGPMLAFYLNAIWAHFLGTKLRFHPKYCFWCSFGEIKFDLTRRNMTASLTHCNGEAENFSFLHLSCLIVTKPTKWHVRQGKTRISLGMRPV